MAAVELIEVCKQIGSQVILDSINLSIEAGEFIVVVGPSGCGKSTLLRLVAGLDQLSSGQILINNHCVNQIPAARRDIAMVFQSYALYPHMTVFDNMAYGLKMRGFKKAEISAKVNQTAALLQLGDYLHRKPASLSGGQRQRVAMGRAIVRSPSLFLFDEPLSNLDAKLRTEMRYEIKKLQRQLGITSLYVTHDQTEAMTMADRIVLLNQGRVEQIGTPHSLYLRPESLFVAGFTGHYSMNFIEGRLDSSAAYVEAACGLRFPVLGEAGPAVAGDSVLIAIRPEHVHLNEHARSNSLHLQVDFIEDMGADKLIQGREKQSGQRIYLRVPASWSDSSETILAHLPAQAIHLFHAKTGRRLGGNHVEAR